MFGYFKFVSLSVSAIFFVLVAGGAAAQLSSDDIAALRAEGQAQGWTFTVGENAATKRSESELAGYKITDVKAFLKEAPLDKPVKGVKGLPSRWDWREQTPGGLPPVRDQGSCGSCWAFSTVGALECAIKINDGIDVNLSEQWLVSCATGILRNGCEYGITAHDWHKGTSSDSCGGNGAVMESDFPYSASEEACSCPFEHHYWIEDWHYIGFPLQVPPVADIKTAIYNYGPITASLEMTKSFIAYKGGVFNDKTPSKGLPNHSIVLVGWDDSVGSAGAFIMRNSWGSDWGDGGYGYIEYETQMIGFGADYIEYGDFAADFRAQPAGGFSSGGPAGGPFVPASTVYTLTNSSSGSIAWAGTAPAWVSLNPSSGTLAAEGAVDVTVTVLGTGLTAGTYTGDIVFTNQTGGTEQVREVSVKIEESAPVTFSLDTNPGWSTMGGWAYGTPLGLDGDPASGATGTKVYGYNLGGEYDNDLGEEYLVAGPIDFRHVADAELRFMRWLGVETSQYDHAKVQVSNNGTSWTTLWSNPASTMQESAWTQCAYDISSVADGQPAVYVRWVMGTTDGSDTFAGWNIDDVAFLGTVTGEGEGAAEGEGATEGVAEGEGALEGLPEGFMEGEGSVEGVPEGEGSAEGIPEGAEEGEGAIEGEPEELDFCATMDRIVAAASSPVMAPLVDMLGEQAALIGMLQCATADVNGPLTTEGELTVSGNGMFDGAYELGVLAELLNHPAAYAGLPSGTMSGQMHIGINAARAASAYAANYSAIYDPLAPMIPALPQLVEYFTEIVLTPEQRDMVLALFPDLISVLAGYATLGDEDSVALVISVTSIVAEAISTMPTDPEDFQRLGIFLGHDGDADGDGYCNEQEYAAAYVSGNAAPYLAAALNPALNPGGEPLCTIAPEGEGQLEGEGTPEGSAEGVLEGQPEGVTEGEGAAEGDLEGQPEGVAEGEGSVEGSAEGVAEGEGSLEGQTEGSGLEGQAEGFGDGEGVPEGLAEGEGVPEGVSEGVAEGEGIPEGVAEGEGVPEGNEEGEGVAEGEPLPKIHTADVNGDNIVQLTELLRVIQFFNSGGYHCAASAGQTEDGYVPGLGAAHGCAAHSSDYAPQDWTISLTELLRLIQFFNSGGYHECPNTYTEDGFCPGVS